MKEKTPFRKFFKKYLLDYKFIIIISLIFAIIGGIAISSEPKKVGEAINIIYEGILGKISGDGQIDFDAIIKTLFEAGYIFAFSFACIVIQGIIITKVIQKALFKLKNETVRKVNRLKIENIENEEKRKQLNSISGHIDLVSQYLNIILNEFVVLIAIFIGSIIYMFSMNTYLTLISAAFLPIMLIIVKVFIVLIRRTIDNSEQKEKEQQYYIDEIFKRHRLIKNLGSEHKIISNFRRTNKITGKKVEKATNYTKQLETITALISNLNYVLILYVGANMVIEGKLSVGDIQSFLLYNRILIKPIYLTSKISNIIFSISESLKRIFEFLDEEEEENTGEVSFSDGNISIKNLSFQYNKNTSLLNNINLEIEKGNKIAIVGKTGAGKTTFMKLLLGFYKSYDGQILINGIDIKQINIDSLRKEIGIVFQDIWLFNGTIKENILYGKENATDEEIIRAAKIAQVHEYIEKLPDKYDTVIDEENSNISSGQKQLICIARLILKNPSILLLDEATNLIDLETEKKVQKAIAEFAKDKTCIIIAHRLSTIVNSDKIVVINNGKIIEEGKHNELLDKKGHYYQMYQILSE